MIDVNAFFFPCVYFFFPPNLENLFPRILCVSKYSHFVGFSHCQQWFFRELFWVNEYVYLKKKKSNSLTIRFFLIQKNRPITNWKTAIAGIVNTMFSFDFIDLSFHPPWNSTNELVHPRAIISWQIFWRESMFPCNERCVGVVLAVLSCLSLLVRQIKFARYIQRKFLFVCLFVYLLSVRLFR